MKNKKEHAMSKREKQLWKKVLAMWPDAMEYEETPALFRHTAERVSDANRAPLR